MSSYFINTLLPHIMQCGSSIKRLPERLLHVYTTGDLCIGQVPWESLGGASVSCGAYHPSRSWKHPLWCSTVNTVVLKYVRFCPPEDILPCPKTCLCYWHVVGRSRGCYQKTFCIVQLPTTKNYVAQYVSGAPFEKFCSKWSFDMSCLCVRGVKFW